MPSAWTDRRAWREKNRVSAIARMELLSEGASVLGHEFPVARKKISLGSGKHGTGTESRGIWV